MQNKDDELISEQYKNHNCTKKQFTNRTFATNRYYVILCMILLLASYILTTFAPVSWSIIIVSFLGVLVSALWWLSVDADNALIKKYKKVLEVLEEGLPVTPSRDEFAAYVEVKDKKINFVFLDVQKVFATLMFLAFLITLIFQIFSYFFGSTFFITCIQ